MPIAPGLRRLRKEDQEFQASLGYIGRLCPKQGKTNKQKNPKKRIWKLQASKPLI
jgi:hypothetical protein